jgi:3'(2'), 5'-bisphosphate nucleotidase
MEITVYENARKVMSRPQVEQLITIAKQAGDIIMHYYRQQNFIQELKSDQSPVTTADKQADNIIRQSLVELYPDIPVISEEYPLASFAERQKWDDFFLVDPLDGTKEFLKRNGEFTVNIAYISSDYRLGVIWAPVLGQLFYADGQHSYQAFEERVERITIGSDTKEKIVVVSRSHMDQTTEEYIDKLKPDRILQVGSSLKFCYVATGMATIYPRLGPINEWDIAAGVVIVEQAGGEATHLNGQKIQFNKCEMFVEPFVVS